ncbi:LOW QUALITY PROTEIN: serine protease, partial [Streptomyces sviceus ATCC 29083]
MRTTPARHLHGRHPELRHHRRPPLHRRRRHRHARPRHPLHPGGPGLPHRPDAPPVRREEHPRGRVRRRAAGLLDDLRPHRRPRRRLRRLRLGGRPYGRHPGTRREGHGVRRHHPRRPGRPRQRGTGPGRPRRTGPAQDGHLAPGAVLMSVSTRRAGLLSVLLAASVALVPPTAAHADGIRAKQWALDAMHTQQAWQTTKGAGVTVAVLDTGVENDHPDLVGNVLTGKDMIGFGATRGDRSWARHGTAMAGIIAGHGHGVGNGDGVMGIAPEAKILPVRVILEDGDPARAKARNTRGNALAEGIRWAADHGADVINLSLGDDSASAHPEAGEDDAVQYALRKGSVVVASAGNGGEKGDHISYPAAYPGVIAATAVDKFGTRASFSTRRWYATVAGPRRRRGHRRPRPQV